MTKRGLILSLAATGCLSFVTVASAHEMPWPRGMPRQMGSGLHVWPVFWLLAVRLAHSDFGIPNWSLVN